MIQINKMGIGSMSTSLKSPVNRIGGKHFLVNFLLQHIPRHTTCVEVFSGAGHLLFAKTPSPIEVLNDIDSNLINFFRVIQDSSKRQMLIDTLNLTPYARVQWEEVRDRVRNTKDIVLTNTLKSKSQKRELIESKLIEHPELSDRQIAKILGVSDKTVGKVRKELTRCADFRTSHIVIDTLGRKQPRRKSRTGDVQKAVDWFFLNRSCFGGDMLKGGFAAPSVSGRSPVQSFRNAVGGLNDVAERLRNVCIESLGYAECIQKYDSPDTLFFCDPPYLDAEHYYSQGNFALDDHHRLSDLLHGVKGKAMITHYQNALYDELYPNWPRHEYESFKGSSKSTGGEKPKTIEVLYTNFKPEFKMRSLFDAAQQL